MIWNTNQVETLTYFMGIFDFLFILLAESDRAVVA